LADVDRKTTLSQVLVQTHLETWVDIGGQTLIKYGWVWVGDEPPTTPVGEA
jgi:hypothetical protein